MAPAEHTLPVGVAQPATRRFKPEPLPAAVLDTLAVVMGKTDGLMSR